MSIIWPHVTEIQRITTTHCDRDAIQVWLASLSGHRRHRSWGVCEEKKMYLKINYGRQNIICRVVVHKGTDCQLCRFFGVYYYFFGKPFWCFLLLQKQTYYYLRYKYNIYYTRQNHAHLGRTTVGQPQLLQSAVPLATL